MELITMETLIDVALQQQKQIQGYISPQPASIRSFELSPNITYTNVTFYVSQKANKSSL